jgi:hypothetical protein
MGMIEAPTVHGLRGKELFLSLDLHHLAHAILSHSTRLTLLLLSRSIELQELTR